MVFYNDNDRFVADWLRNLIDAGHLPAGRVDSRSIVDLHPEDCSSESHFFAGIGGWPYALRLAGWPDDVPVWTGSCPCQPFSRIGLRRGAEDERHLWPIWARLIRECRPPAVFGEQVAGPAGREWLAGVQADLEAMGYAFGAVDLSPACLGSPQGRQRLYWVALSIGERLEGQPRPEHHGAKPGRKRKAESRSASETGPSLSESPGVVDASVLRGLSVCSSRSTRRRLSLPANRAVDEESLRIWDRYDGLACEDGWRRIEPSTFPLAHGISRRVGRLRAYGNAIVPQLAAVFIRSVVDVLTETP